MQSLFCGKTDSHSGPCHRWCTTGMLRAVESALCPDKSYPPRSKGTSTMHSELEKEWPRRGLRSSVATVSVRVIGGEDNALHAIDVRSDRYMGQCRGLAWYRRSARNKMARFAPRLRRRRSRERPSRTEYASSLTPGSFLTVHRNLQHNRWATSRHACCRRPH